MAQPTPSSSRTSVEIFSSTGAVSARKLSARQKHKLQLRILRQRIAAKRASGQKLTAVEAHLARRLGRIERCLLGPTPVAAAAEICRIMFRPMPIVLVAGLVLAAEGSTVAWLTGPTERETAGNTQTAQQAAAEAEANRLMQIAQQLNAQGEAGALPAKQTAATFRDVAAAAQAAAAEEQPVEIALAQVSQQSGGLAQFISQQVKNIGAILPQEEPAALSAYEATYPGLIQFLSGVIAVFYPSELESGKIARHIVEISLRENIDPVFVASIIAVESSFRKSARSQVGAMGLMQVRPSTARAILATQRSNPKAALALSDPKQNIELGIAYLKYLERRYNGNLRLVLAAYNWGPTNLSKALKNRTPIPGSVEKYASRIIEKTKAWHAHYDVANAQASALKKAS